MEAAVGEEKLRILEQREEMEKSVDEIREGFNKREAVLEASNPAPYVVVAASILRIVTKARFAKSREVQQSFAIF